MNTVSTNTRGYSAETLAIVHDLLRIATTTPSNIADVFVDFSPHVDYVSVSIHPGGWKETTAAFRESADISTICGPAAELRVKLLQFLEGLTALTPEQIRAAKVAALREQAALALAADEELEATTVSAV